MIANLYGNPHSASNSSQLTTRRIEDIRLRLLGLFKADPDEFDVVFVANATAGIKLVMEAFRDQEEGYWYGYHRDAHTSLIGVREAATQHRCFTTDAEVSAWVEQEGTLGLSHGLFAYPAQSNMNGRRLPLDWTRRIRMRKQGSVYTLLDAAALVSTSPLDLSDACSAPDFTVLSLYKMFGFPDLGALIVRKAAGAIFDKRRYFGGGTVEMVVSNPKSTVHVMPLLITPCKGLLERTVAREEANTARKIRRRNSTDSQHHGSGYCNERAQRIV
jgi:molybdenum cofactor sulfurtransferase